jgi:S-adenosylmethionine:tRNA ribosyltransferase-isomerase
LHFTNELLKKTQELGVQIVYITLHTGLGTFKPVKTEDITKHKMEPEYYKVAAATFETIKKAKHENRRIIAVGSTVAKTLETMVRHGWEEPNLSGYTDLFIYPGYKFNAADALITNFHLPKSTLLMLVSAFTGKDFVRKAYQEAIKQGYRFFSYGDAMMII